MYFFLLFILNFSDKNSDLGPLFQSERLSFYESHAEQLVGTGKAYRCFCDPTRLELLRKNAAKRQEKIAYDGKCRHLSQAQIEKFLNEKKPHVIRFKLDGDEREVAFNDMAVGVHKSAPGKQEGDFVIMKSDGFPTYHFANVVDDHLMKITHVLRGQEWLLSVTHNYNANLISNLSLFFFLIAILKDCQAYSHVRSIWLATSNLRTSTSSMQ